MCINKREDSITGSCWAKTVLYTVIYGLHLSRVNRQGLRSKKSCSVHRKPEGVFPSLSTLNFPLLVFIHLSAFSSIYGPYCIQQRFSKRDWQASIYLLEFFGFFLHFFYYYYYLKFFSCLIFLKFKVFSIFFITFASFFAHSYFLNFPPLFFWICNAIFFIFTSIFGIICLIFFFKFLRRFYLNFEAFFNFCAK